jgi:phenylacetate-CoA ligase
LLWAGLRRGDRRAWLRGDMVVPLGQARPPFWRYNRTDNMLMLSPFHLSEANADTFISALEQFDPVVVQAYPASIAFLAKHLETRNRRYRGQHLTGIVTSSETLYDEQRRVVQEMFGARVYDWYGSFERVAAIGTCEQGNYHVLSDYGLIELLPLGDGTAEIVGTGFDNLLMPLIRYQSVDSVVPGDPKYSCPCRRQFPVVEKVLGRLDDQIKTADGRHHTALDFIFYGMESLAEAQIVQDRLDHIILVIVPAGGFGLSDIEVLKRRAHERLGRGVVVDVEVVKEIPRTKAAKFRGIVCKV